MTFSQALGMFGRQKGVWRRFILLPTAGIVIVAAGLTLIAFESIGGMITAMICLGLPSLAVTYVTGAAYYRSRFVATMDMPQVMANETILRRGDEIEIDYGQRFKKDVTITQLQVQLIMQEWVEYQSGTDRSTATRDIPISEDWVENVPVTAGQTFKHKFTLRVPDDAMHTFIASYNKIRWRIHVELDLPGWVDFRTDYDVEVEARVNDAAV